MEKKLKSHDNVVNKSTQTDSWTPLLKRKNSQEIVSQDEKKKSLTLTKNRANENSAANFKMPTQYQNEMPQASAPKSSMKNLLENDDSCFDFSQLPKSTAQHEKKNNFIDISVC